MISDRYNAPLRQNGSTMAFKVFNGLSLIINGSIIFIGSNIISRIQRNLSSMGFQTSN